MSSAFTTLATYGLLKICYTMGPPCICILAIALILEVAKNNLENFV
jgi:hypothetical protein